MTIHTPEPASVRVAVMLPPSVAARLRAVARSDRRSVSLAARVILEDHLSRLPEPLQDATEAEAAGYLGGAYEALQDGTEAVSGPADGPLSAYPSAMLREDEDGFFVEEEGYYPGLRDRD